MIFAYVVSHTSVFDEEMRRTFTEIGTEAMHGEWTTIFIKAIFAGWLIALMVWLLPAAESARIWVIIIMTYLVAVSELAHIIAGTVETSYAVMTGAGTWSNYFIDWMIPTLLGNIVGGVSLVAVLAHAQVVNENNSEKPNI